MDTSNFKINDKQEATEFILGFANKIKVVLPDKVVSLAMSVIDFYNNE